MNERYEHNDMEVLLAHAVAGTLTPEEEELLQRWLEEDARHASELEQLRKVWQHAGDLTPLVRPDLDREWSDLRRRLHLHHRRNLQVVHRKKRFTRLLRVAAVIITGLFAAALVQLVTGPLTHHVYTAATATEMFTLPDGSRVHLDRGSRLMVPRPFGKRNRKVSLRGTAYFEVRHDATRPFTVHAGSVDITVLGTRFSVSSNRGGTTVDLVEGKVQVTAPDSRVILQPGEEARWSPNEKKLSKEPIRDPNFLAWKTRHLTFEATPLRQVLTTLEKTYHTRFLTPDTAALDCRVTAIFDREPLQNVLATLAEVLDISFEQNVQEGYVVKGKGCH